MVSPHTSSQSLQTEVIYDEVKTQEKTLETRLIITENQNRAQFHKQLRLVLALFGLTCLMLVLAIIILSFYYQNEQRQSSLLTQQNLKLQGETTALKRQTAELHRDREQLNWTIGVILEYNNFPVTEHCPDKVCKPCLDDWLLFQSNCYLITKISYGWKTWKQSRDSCAEKNAELVVIDSQEEQEFLKTNIEKYNDDKHGYWIGLQKDTKDMWTWVDGRNVSVTYWSTAEPGYSYACGLTNPHINHLSNWGKASCTMKNRWICETRALTGPD
ncbi:C-type lectin domain family 4 member A isoform X2 [Fundulus heteroclitus]|uniref:C-type lectin domain family 4 member A isoform X2 n=1 Tax=Fundulus heteroclitus TaxID=8078 RepID=UPI00165CD151|nr:C-type lectin domain family 4 member A isoform X2 [Fundulus heteroclitus]